MQVIAYDIYYCGKHYKRCYNEDDVWGYLFHLGLGSDNWVVFDQWGKLLTEFFWSDRRGRELNRVRYFINDYGQIFLQE